MGILTAIRARADAKRARDAYRAAQKQTAGSLDALRFCSQPLERHALLTDAATHATTAANTFVAGYGTDPNNENDRATTETMHHVATLYLLLAAVEESLMYGFRAVPVGGRDDLPESEWALFDAAHGPLSEMAATPYLDDRLRLLENLHDAVEPVIGGDAAETLWCLPGQGFIGWTTEAERDDWDLHHAHLDRLTYERIENGATP